MTGIVNRSLLKIQSLAVFWLETTEASVYLFQKDPMEVNGKVVAQIRPYRNTDKRQNVCHCFFECLNGSTLIPYLLTLISALLVAIPASCLALRMRSASWERKALFRKLQLRSLQRYSANIIFIRDIVWAAVLFIPVLSSIMRFRCVFCGFLRRILRCLLHAWLSWSMHSAS